MAKWDGANWSALGSGITNGAVDGLVAAGTNLYVLGNFTKDAGVGANGIARWDGTAWSALGSGMNGAYCAVADGTNLYVGGAFATAGGITAQRIAKWDGTS